MRPMRNERVTMMALDYASYIYEGLREGMKTAAREYVKDSLAKFPRGKEEFFDIWARKTNMRPEHVGRVLLRWWMMEDTAPFAQEDMMGFFDALKAAGKAWLVGDLVQVAAGEATETLRDLMRDHGIAA